MDSTGDDIGDSVGRGNAVRAALCQGATELHIVMDTQRDHNMAQMLEEVGMSRMNREQDFARQWATCPVPSLYDEIYYNE